MENAQEILVVILSTALAIFLALGIALLIICIKIAQRVKRITENAEAISDKAENLAEFLQSAASPMVIGRIISSVSDIFFKRDKRR